MNHINIIAFVYSLLYLILNPRSTECICDLIMKAVIIKTLEEGDGTFTLKKLKKTVLKDSDLTEEDFDATIEKLMNKGKVGFDCEDKYLKLLKKRKSDNEEIPGESKQLASIEKKMKVENNETTKASKSLKGLYPELWSTGEKLWKENAFDQNYLLQYPDGITRIFCGNLNKKVGGVRVFKYIISFSVYSGKLFQ